MNINEIIRHAMHPASVVRQPTSIEEARTFVEKMPSVSCLVVHGGKVEYQFEIIESANKTQIKRSLNVFSNITAIIRCFKMPVSGTRYFFHFSGDGCHFRRQQFPVLANGREVGNEHVILWPLSISPGHYLHDEIVRYLKAPDTLPWREKAPRFIFRGRNSGNPFSCTQYVWNTMRNSRCDLLWESLKLPETLRTKTDIGFIGLYPSWWKLKFFGGNYKFLNKNFSAILKEDHSLEDLKNEIKQLLEFTRRPVSRKKIANNKFIICPEGFDVASSLCWVLASNCLAVVPPFHFENLIINAGALKPFEHFLPIAEDYSDLQEVMTWALDHDDECAKMVKNANNYVANFLQDTSMIEVQKQILQRLLIQDDLEVAG